MIVGVLEILLDDVVVNVLDAHLSLHPVQIHRLQLQHHQRAGGVLGERLVNPDPNLLTGVHLAMYQMRLD
jgi:hypothetical protein